MKAITVTSKRQATLPVEVCKDLGIGPGDKVELERRELDGETVWVLKAPGRDWSWLGAARRFAEGKSHEWEQVERSISRGMADDDDRP